ncbi:MAG: hypothetical protein ACLFTR_02950 [Candidatus Woesearchaeota archaeon]
MVNFNDMLALLAKIGVWDIVLPFMLVFTIVYATLTTTLKSMFGKHGEGDDAQDNSKYAAVISFVIGLGVVIPHAIGAYPPGADVVEIINSSLPQVALISVAILGLLILVGMFGIKADASGTGLGSIIVMVSIGFIVYIFGASAGWWSSPSGIFRFLNDPETVTLVISLLVFGIVVWFITKDDGGSSGDGFGKKMNNFINELTKKQ